MAKKLYRATVAREIEVYFVADESTGERALERLADQYAGEEEESVYDVTVYLQPVGNPQHRPRVWSMDSLVYGTEDDMTLAEATREFVK